MSRRESDPQVAAALAGIILILGFGFFIFIVGWGLVNWAGPDDFERLCKDSGNTHVAYLDNDHRVCIRGEKVILHD